MNFFVRSIGVVAVAGLLTSCGGGGSGTITGTTGGGGGGGNGETCTTGTFCMSGSTFFPTSATVASGATVTWVNNSGVTHNVTFDNPSSVPGGNVPDFSSGTATRIISTPGTYHFICTIHGLSMSATLTVQ